MIDEKIIELLLNVERAVSILSGYVRGAFVREDKEPIIRVCADVADFSITENMTLSVANDTNKNDILTVSFDFTKKDLKKMRKEFNKHYAQNGLVLNVRAKGNVYEIRYRRDGLNLSASSKNLQEAKKKMKYLLMEAYNIKAMQEVNREELAQKRKTAAQYFEWYINEVKRPTSNAMYIKNLVGYLDRNLRPTFGDRFLSEITFADLQGIINKLTAAGKNRTAKGVRTLLIEVYRSAVYDGEVQVNHAERIAPIIYQQEHGHALTRQEEKLAVKAILESNSAHKNDFLILLFTGVRPCELRTMTFEKDFVSVICAKTRTGLRRSRRIPMTPMFRRYVDVKRQIIPVETRQLEKSLKVFFDGEITLYDFRHTFITRAQECGVPVEVVQAWVGHSSKTLMGRTYTHYSDAYLMKMAKKMDY